MLKIKELLKVLVETQKQINKSLKELNENITSEKEKLNTGFCTLNKLNNAIQTNIYTKEETIASIPLTFTHLLFPLLNFPLYK